MAWTSALYVVIMASEATLNNCIKTTCTVAASHLPKERRRKKRPKEVARCITRSIMRKKTWTVRIQTDLRTP